MKIEIAFCLLSLALLPACSTTSQTTTANQTLEQRLMTKYASNATEPGTPGEEPAPKVQKMFRPMLPRRSIKTRR